MENRSSQQKLALTTRLPEAMQLSEKLYLFLKNSNRLSGYTDELIAMQILKQLLSEKLNIGGLAVFSGYQVDPYVLADSEQPAEFLKESPVENGFPVHVLFFESLNLVLTFNPNFFSSSNPTLIKLDLIGDGCLKLCNEVSDFIDCSSLIAEFEATTVQPDAEKHAPAMASITGIAAAHPIAIADNLHTLKMNSLKYGDFLDLISESLLNFLKSDKLQKENSDHDLLAEKNKELLENITKDFSELIDCLSASFQSRLKPEYSEADLLKIKASPLDWCCLFSSSAVLAMIFCANHKLMREILNEENFDINSFYLAPYDAPILVDRVIQKIYAKSETNIDKALIHLFEHIAIFRTM